MDSKLYNPSTDYDVDGALKAGLSHTQIADYLSSKTDYDVSAARTAGLSDSQIVSYLAPPEPTGSDFIAGLKTSFKQLPALGWGLGAITAAGIESAAGQGGLATAAKDFSVKKMQDANQSVAADQRSVYEMDTAWGRAKEGDIGALVDFFSYAVGYGVGQGLQVAATAGGGKLLAQAALKPAVEKLAGEMVAKEAAQIAATKAGVNLTQEQLTAAAVKNVAGSIGQYGSLGAYSLGMEGGEIGGALAEQSSKEGRVLTGAELARGLGATLLAGSFEYGENLLTLGALKGFKGSNLPFSQTAGVGGRLGRAATGAAIAAPGEGVTEYLQTGVEEYGKGTEENILTWNQSEEAQRQAINAAGMGAIGGGTIGSIGGLITGAQSRQRDDSLDQLKDATDAGSAAIAADAAAGDMDMILRQTVDSQLTPAVTADLGGAAIPTPAQALSAAPQQIDGNPLAAATLEERQALIDRQAGLINEANTPGIPAFDRENLLAQAQTARGTPAPGAAANFVDLTPMTAQEAQTRLAVMRDTTANAGGNSLELAVVPHPSQAGAFAIAKQALPSLDLNAPAAGPSAAQAQYQVEASALAGTDTARRADDQPRQEIISRAMRSVQERGGVASPAEAQIFREANLGQPYDRVDPSLAPDLSVDQKLTQATGIPLVPQAREQVSQQQPSNEISADQAARQQSDLAQSERTLQGQIEATKMAPTPTASIIEALAVPKANRTQSQRVTVEQAETTFSEADFSILQRAANAPFLLDKTERTRLAELKKTPQAPAPVATPTDNLMGERTRNALGLPSAGSIVQTDVKLSTTREQVPGSTATINDKGTEHTYTVAESGALPGMTKLIQQLARRFGKKVVFFNSDTLKADGFVSNADNKTLFINAKSQMSPLAVFGHELLHLLKRDNPLAYRAVAAVVARRFDSETRAKYRKDYRAGANIEELSADLMGNAFQDENFLTDVFTEIAESAPEGEARGIIMRLAAAINQSIKAAMDVISKMAPGRQQFEADALVKNLEDIRAALKTALVTYAKDQKIPAMQMETERAQAESSTTLTAATSNEASEITASGPRLTPEQRAQREIDRKLGLSVSNEQRRGTAVLASAKPGNKLATVTGRTGKDMERLHARATAILSAAPAQALFTSMGLRNVSFVTFNGSWEGTPELSFFITAKDAQGEPLTYEKTRGLGAVLASAFQQDAAITSHAIPGTPEKGTPDLATSLYFAKGNGDLLTAKEVAKGFKAFNAIGEDASITPDGKAFKFLYFGADEGGEAYARKLITVANKLGYTASSRSYNRGNLDKFQSQENEDGSISRSYRSLGQQAWDSALAAGSPGVLERATSALLVPYILAVKAEGFGFNYTRWQQVNDATREQRQQLEAAVAAADAANKHGLVPRLREKINISKLGNVPLTPLITQKTTSGNAVEQLAALDDLLIQFPDILSSAENYLKAEARAFGSNDVPVAPRNIIDFLKDGGKKIIEQLSRLPSNMLAGANSGFANAREFFRLYTTKQVPIETTGKLMLWSFLSRGVSPYVQEAMFIDAVRGVEPFVKASAEGNFGPDMRSRYTAWAESISKQNGAASPGNGTTHNLNAFGATFLTRMSERMEDGRTKLQYLHDMLSDPNMTGRQIRREFVKMGEGVGIDNKVLSFTLLVTGRTDVIVLDRVQMKNIYDDGSFANYNLYDGTYQTAIRHRLPPSVSVIDDYGQSVGMHRNQITDDYGNTLDDKLMNKLSSVDTYAVLEQREGETNSAFDTRVNQAIDAVATRTKIPKNELIDERAIKPGSGLASMTTGVRGLMLYESIENELDRVLPRVYKALGRPEDASPGRWHWESWVVSSGQEASHGTLDALLAEAKQEPNPFSDVPVKQGEYGMTDYGVRYARDTNNKQYYLYDDSTGQPYRFTPGSWREALAAIKKTFPSKFLVTMNADRTDRTEPWYLDPRIDRNKIDAAVREIGVIDNSNGITKSSQRAAPDTPAFKRWFGDSQVVNAEGQPLVVYHGTMSDVEEFSSDFQMASPAFYFSSATDEANQYAARLSAGTGEIVEGGGNVMPAYLSIKNPFRPTGGIYADTRLKKLAVALMEKIPRLKKELDAMRSVKSFIGIRQEQVDQLTSLGYDGIIDGTVYIAFKPTQIKSAIGNNGEYSRTNNNITKSTPRFYSALAKGIDGIQTKAAPAAGWKDAIKGLVNKGTAKADEVEWSGVNDWLDLQEGRVTKDQVTTYLSENGVRVEETLMSEPDEIPVQRQEMTEYFDEPFDPNGDVADRIYQLSFTEPGKEEPTNFTAYRVDGRYALYDDRSNFIDEFSSIRDAETYVEGEARFAAEQGVKPRYGDYTLPGGENYRELLLTLPSAKSKGQRGTVTFTNEDALDDFLVDVSAAGMESLDYGAVTDDQGQRLVAEFASVTADDATKIKQLASAGNATVDFKPDTTAPAFRSAHWKDDNVIAHMRVNDRTDVDGNKVLFVEELQSDWSQAGTKTRRNEIKRLVDGGMPKNEAQKSVPMDFGFNSETPKAPFVVGTEGWLNLALKRVMAMAVEGEYDKVAFVNGEQSVERYDLSKEVDAIEYRKNKDGLYQIAAIKQGTEATRQSGLSEAELEGVVGKEVASKIIEGYGSEQRQGYKRLTGLDLKVGGEGMQAFYDKIVPQALNKLLPKLGGEKLGAVEIEGVNNASYGIAFNAKDKTWTANVNNKSVGVFDLKDAASAAAKAAYDAIVIKQPGFAVTDTMREKLAEGQALFSSQRIVGESKRDYTPEQRQMFENTGRTVTELTIKERVKELRKDFALKMTQGMVDPFSSVKALDFKSYILVRMSRGTAGALEALLKYGKVSLNDGVYDADQSGGFLDRVGIPLQGELEDFMWWVAANRAERLSKEDREHLFTATDIEAGKSLSSGTTEYDYTMQHGVDAGKVTRDRSKVYRDSLTSFDEFNQNALDMAEQQGLIDPESRKIWANEFYVPFYRVVEEDGSFKGGSVKDGLLRQEAFKRLKGGTDKLSPDLLANTMQNWAHLLEAGAKNAAAASTLKAAELVDAAQPASSSTPDAVWYMGPVTRTIPKGKPYVDGGVEKVSDGTAEVTSTEKIYYTVSDPYILASISAINFTGFKNPVMDAMTSFKRALTIGVTASPYYKVKNLMRDTLQAVATAPLDYNVLKNVYQGGKEADAAGAFANLGRAAIGVAPKKLNVSQTYVSALAGGGLIRFGNMLDGNDATHTRMLIDRGVDKATILDSDEKIKAVFGKFKQAFDAYNEAGARGEEVNRAALYKQLIGKGMGHAEASFMARDLMDFSLQGTFQTVRFLTQVVPFMNARLQGLYKLGRSAKADPKRFTAVVGATALFSIMLMLSYKDDDDWKKREDWDRNTNWWFKFGGVAFRIPKPFEVGAIATLAERGLEFFISKEMTGKRLGKNVWDILGDNLSMDPIPQAIKPLLDIYSNKDSFTGRPIESMSMQRLKPEYRFSSYNSMAARGLSTAGNTVSGVVNMEFLSPVQIDHIVRGYFGWLGTFVVGGTDMMVRPLTDEKTRPASDMWKVASGNMAYSLPSDQSRYVSQMYDQAKVLEQAYATWRQLQKDRKPEEAREFLEANREKLIRYKQVAGVKRNQAKFNEMIRMVQRSSSMDADAKARRISDIRRRMDLMARRVAPGYEQSRAQ